MSRAPQQRSGLDHRTISSKQQITGINVLGFLPRVVSDIPELVTPGGGDRGVADLELDERVFVRPDRRYCTSTRLTRLRVVSKHDVTNS